MAVTFPTFQERWDSGVQTGDLPLKEQGCYLAASKLNLNYLFL